MDYLKILQWDKTFHAPRSERIDRHEGENQKTQEVMEGHRTLKAVSMGQEGNARMGFPHF